MPDTPKKGNPLTKKAGPLPVWGWAAAGAGGFLLYKWWKGRQAATAAAGLSGGNTIPASSGTNTSGPTSFATLAAWEAAAIATMVADGLDANGALNAITAWLNGNCVSQAGYNALQAVITSDGLPPGFTGSHVPSLSVCASTTTTTTPPSTTPPPATTPPPTLGIGGNVSQTVSDFSNEIAAIGRGGAGGGYVTTGFSSPVSSYYDYQGVSPSTQTTFNGGTTVWNYLLPSGWVSVDPVSMTPAFHTDATGQVVSTPVANSG